MSDKHPRQPVVYRDGNVIRFKENKIVCWMMEQGRARKGFDLNCIVDLYRAGEFSLEDLIQVDKLLGYSASGFCGLSYVPIEEVELCNQEVNRLRNPKWVIRFDDNKLFNYNGFEVELQKASRYDTEQEARAVVDELVGPCTVLKETDAED
jgi:hypothetical protein